jgi:hypothetical protein
MPTGSVPVEDPSTGREGPSSVVADDHRGVHGRGPRGVMIESAGGWSRWNGEVYPGVVVKVKQKLGSENRAWQGV